MSRVQRGTFLSPLYPEAWQEASFSLLQYQVLLQWQLRAFSLSVLAGGRAAACPKRQASTGRPITPKPMIAHRVAAPHMVSAITPSLISYLRQDNRQNGIIDMSEFTLGSGPHVERCVVSAAQRFAVKIGGWHKLA